MKIDTKKIILFISFIFTICIVSCLINDLVKGEFGYSVKGLFSKNSASAHNDDSKDKTKKDAKKDAKKDDISKNEDDPVDEDISSSSNTSSEDNIPEVTASPSESVEVIAPLPDENNGVASSEPQSDETRYAYLTFDDGPSPNTVRILDILDSYNVKATFFVMYHEGFEDAYKQIVSRGHTIALHTYSHAYHQIYSNELAYYEDLKQISDYVNALTGVTTNIIRFPGGSSNNISKSYCPGIMSSLVTTTVENGFMFHDWNVDSMDASELSVPAEQILNNVLSASSTKHNSHILMHDLETKNTTVDALPGIIEGLIAQGYTIAPITEQTPPCHHSMINN